MFLMFTVLNLIMQKMWFMLISCFPIRVSEIWCTPGSGCLSDQCLIGTLTGLLWRQHFSLVANNPFLRELNTSCFCTREWLGNSHPFASRHCPCDLHFVNSALDPFGVINHGNRYDNILSPRSLPGEWSNLEDDLGDQHAFCFTLRHHLFTFLPSKGLCLYGYAEFPTKPP